MRAQLAIVALLLRVHWLWLLPLLRRNRPKTDWNYHPHARTFDDSTRMIGNGWKGKYS
jgi:hypothetical protein